MLDDLKVDQFPMGLFTTQAARLMDWSGNPDDPEWQKLIGEIQAKAMPAWVGRLLAYKDEEIHTERKKREAAQASADAARSELDKELTGGDDLRQARDAAAADAERARAELSGLKEAVAEARSQNEKINEQLVKAEKKGAATGSRLPAWGVVAASLAALIAGAGGTYVFQSVPTQKLAADAAAKVELARTEHAATVETLRAEKAKAEERAERLLAEADKARAERNATDEQIAKLKVELDTTQRQLGYERNRAEGAEASLKNISPTQLQKENQAEDVRQQIAQARELGFSVTMGQLFDPRTFNARDWSNNPSATVQRCAQSCLESPSCQAFDYTSSTSTGCRHFRYIYGDYTDAVDGIVAHKQQTRR